MSHSQSENSDCANSSKKWTILRLSKTIILAFVVLFALCSFILIPEKREDWINIAPKSNDTIFLNLTNELDLINPIWTIKARSAFLPHNYSAFSKKHVNFTLIRLKNGEEVARHKKPWSVAIATSRPNQDFIRTEVEHSFILSSAASFNDPDFDPDFIEHIFDEGSEYQLEVITNDVQPVAIALTMSAYSELSLKGVIMAGCILVLLYVLIIFEVVHRTLAAMIGATAAIACLTIIHDVSGINYIKII